MKRFCAAVLTAALAFGFVLSAFAAETNYDAIAEELLKLINAERRRAGIHELDKDRTLMKLAGKRAEEIMTVYGHYRPDGTPFYSIFDEFDFPAMASGENVSSGQENPREANESFMDSPSHKETMLSTRYHRVGVGVRKEGRRFFWVELFVGD